MYSYREKVIICLSFLFIMADVISEHIEYSLSFQETHLMEAVLSYIILVELILWLKWRVCYVPKIDN